LTVNQLVVGSIPTAGANFSRFIKVLEVRRPPLWWARNPLEA
jgi:hypothetical protein